MNTFLNIGYINFLKEFDKCYMFSFNVNTRAKNGSSFYVNAVVFKNEWTPQLKDKQKVFIKGHLSLEKYTDKNQVERECIKLYAESVEIVNNPSNKQTQGNVSQKATHSKQCASGNANKEQNINEDYIPF